MDARPHIPLSEVIFAALIATGIAPGYVWLTSSDAGRIHDMVFGMWTLVLMLLLCAPRVYVPSPTQEP
jgi:hypothetical protein